MYRPSVLSAMLTGLQLSILLPTAIAQSPAVFKQDVEYGDLTFAATGVRGTGDLFFHIEAPAENTWAAVGVGTEMKGSLIWVFYRNKAGSGVTFCSRVTDREAEPAHYGKSLCDMDTREGKQNGIFPVQKTVVLPNGNNETETRDYFVANVHCKNMTLDGKMPKEDDKPKKKPKVEYEWKGYFELPKLDLSNTAQPFIYALGPTDRRLACDSKGVPLRRHVMNGHIRMDMTKATVDTRADVPHKELGSVGGWTNQHARSEGEPKEDGGGWEGTVHAVLMSSTLIVLFPVGVIFLRLLNQVKPHAILQGIGCALIVTGVGIGVWAGMKYNQTKKVRNYHQIVGLCVVAATLLQFGLGMANHRTYTRTGKRTRLGKIHVPLGSCILIAGAINGFLGFRITASGYQYIIYAVILAFSFLGLAVAMIYVKKLKKREYRQTMDREALDAAFETYKHRLADDEAGKAGNFKPEGTLSTESQGRESGVLLHHMPPQISPNLGTSHRQEDQIRCID